MGETMVDPKRWHTREDSGLRLDRQLRWWHDDALVEHPRIIEAFNQGLRPTDDGRFQLHVGQDWCFVEVADAAFAVVAVDFAGERPCIRLSDRTAEPLGLPSLSLDPDGVLHCRVKEGRAKARFTRDAQFELGSRFEPDGPKLRLRVGDRLFPLPLASFPET